MAKRYYFKRYIDLGPMPRLLEVIWGDEGPDGRPVIASGVFTGQKGLFEKMKHNKRLFERDQLASGEWVLTAYKLSSRLSTRNRIEIENKTALLKDGVIVPTDDNLIEEIV